MLKKNFSIFGYKLIKENEFYKIISNLIEKAQPTLEIEESVKKHIDSLKRQIMLYETIHPDLKDIQVSKPDFLEHIQL
jgi:hypothetical protein